VVTLAKLVGVCKIDIKVVGESIELEMHFDDAMKKALEGIYALDKVGTAQPVDEVLVAAKVKVAIFADNIAKDATMMAVAAETLKGDLYYMDLDGKFDAAFGQLDYDYLMQSRLGYFLKELGKDDNEITRGEFANGKYGEALVVVLKEKAMKSIGDSITAAGKDIAVVQNLKPGPQGQGAAFAVALEGGQFKVIFPPGYDEKYQAEAQKGNSEYEEEQARIAEVKGSPFGWFLTKIMGFKEEDWKAVGDGSHPISYFLGAVGVASGGTIFAWYQSKWNGAKNNAEKFPQSAPLFASVEAAAAKVATFVGEKAGSIVDTLKNAAPKSAQDFGAIIEKGKDEPVEVADEKGIKLTAKYKVSGSVTIKLSKGEMLAFPSETAVERDGKPVSLKSVSATEDTVLVLKSDIPNGSYFSKGVKFQEVKKPAEQATA
jgi:hypothetical protein